jgi:uncharacterized protein (TIGR03000 family)
MIVFRKYLKTAGVAALVAAGLLLPAAPAGAQQGWPINGDNWGSRGGSGSYRGGGGGYGYSSPGYSSGYYAPGPAYTYSTPTYTYSTPTYYPPLGQVLSVTSAAPESSYYLTAAEVEGPRAIQIDMHLPADAKVWFDDAPTSQTGALRRFVSPPLDPDKDYFYQVKVRWQEDGRDVTRTRKVEVHAGDRLNLSFGPIAVGSARR